MTDRYSRSLKRDASIRKCQNKIKESFFTSGLTPEQLYYNRGEEQREKVVEEKPSLTETEMLETLD